MKSTNIIPVAEVASYLGTSPRKATRMTINGTLPIGSVAEPTKENEEYTTRILRSRWEMWIKGELKL